MRAPAGERPQPLRSRLRSMKVWQPKPEEVAAPVEEPEDLAAVLADW